MSHHFTWPLGMGRSGAEIEYLLRCYGIRATCREMGHQMGLSVRDSQAVWAEHILCKAGVPLTSPLLDPRNAIYAQHSGATMPTPWGATVGPGDMVGRLVDVIDG